MRIALFLQCDAALLVISVVAVFLRRRPAVAAIVYGGSLVLSVALLAGALGRLIAGASPDGVVLPIGLPWVGSHFRIDALSAFFLVVINLGAAAASLYGLGHSRHEQDQQRVLPFFPAFLAGMNLVLLADDAFTFLASWEFMSLASWALVMARHQEADNARAGYVYIVMASLGTMALLLAFALLAGPLGGYAFATMRASGVTPGVAGLVLALVLIGAGSKAGLVPLHVWLPLAHPAAPSHVSALMSGVMTKVAIYAFVRIVFDLLGEPAWWWSVVVLTLGAATAVMGVLYALMQHDLKRLLAYHTSRISGSSIIGLGLALAFKVFDMPAAAALALTAGAPAHIQSFRFQEPPIPWRRRRSDRDRRTRHGASGRPHSPHAANGFRISGRVRGHLRAAAVQRLRIRMADFSSHLAQSPVAVLGIEDIGAGGRRPARAFRRARRRMLHQSLRR